MRYYEMQMPANRFTAPLNDKLVLNAGYLEPCRLFPRAFIKTAINSYKNGYKKCTGDKQKMTEQDFTHFDESGRARMVNVGDKEITKRTAVAEGRVLLNPHTFELIKSGGMKKGDVLATAQIAGIMGAKRTPDLIPMCHPLFLSGIRLAEDRRRTWRLHSRLIISQTSAWCRRPAAYMGITQQTDNITDIRPVQKTGGVHRDYTAD